MNTILYPEDLSQECIDSCSHSGQCLGDVQFWQKNLKFTVPREKAIKYLRGFGAWTDEELADETDTVIAERILWLACNDFAEGEDFFSLE